MKVHLPRIPAVGMHFLAGLVFVSIAFSAAGRRVGAAFADGEPPLPDGRSGNQRTTNANGNQQPPPPRMHTTRHHSFLLANGTVVHRQPPPPPPSATAQSQLIDLAELSRMSATASPSPPPPLDDPRNRSSVQKRQPLPAPSTYFADRTELSRNISFLLENLLERYEKSHLPTHGQGVPTVVKTNMVIRSMGPVSELDMDYSMDCYFRQHWRDTRLKFRGPMQTLSLSIKMLERIWRPDTYFYNGKHSHIHTITVPNKLLRLTQDGDILYSMRLTIKASCPMELRNFPMDRQSCPLILGSYAYTTKSLVYEWEGSDSVTFVQGMTLSQFDLISIPQRNFTYTRREGDFSVLQVSFNMQRLSGYFLIQVYVPCILIVVLSWVSFWIHREATSDRVGLGITTVLTLSTISLDSRTDLPKVRYATALDWFLLMSFFYCIATLLEFAGVHFFTKVGSGEIPATLGDYEDDEEVAEGTQGKAGSGGGADGSGASNGGRRVVTTTGGQDDAGEWEDMADGEGLTTDDDDDDGGGGGDEDGDEEETLGGGNSRATQVDGSAIDVVAMEPMSMSALGLKKCVGLSRDALLCPIYGDPVSMFRIHPNVDSATATASATATMSALSAQSSRMSTMERQTQTEVPRKAKWQQIWLCVLGDENFRRQRQREASEKCTGRARYINSVSLIDRTARVGFPMSFGILNILYWLVYVTFQEDFPVPGQ